MLIHMHACAIFSKTKQNILPKKKLTSTLILEVGEENQLLREDEQA